jgi:uncharacterized membrane protein
MMGGGILIWLLLAGLVVAAVGGIDRLRELLQLNATGGDSSRGLAPEEILRERYARGELSREEYLEAQETLAK